MAMADTYNKSDRLVRERVFVFFLPTLGARVTAKRTRLHGDQVTERGLYQDENHSRVPNQLQEHRAVHKAQAMVVSDANVLRKCRIAVNVIIPDNLM